VAGSRSTSIVPVRSGKRFAARQQAGIAQ
jgi:hypothetical protein